MTTGSINGNRISENEAVAETPGPIFTRDIPGLREYYASFTAENAEKGKTLPLMAADDTNQRRELPRMDADERGLEPLHEHGLSTMRVGPLAQRDLAGFGAELDRRTWIQAVDR